MDYCDTGGYVQVLHTPNVPQVIEGVELFNMGQMGVVNRFPLQFLYTGTVAGTSIARNTIRGSNHRCISMDGVSNATIASNVAYDTAGHVSLVCTALTLVTLQIITHLESSFSSQISVIISDLKPRTMILWIIWVHIQMTTWAIMNKQLVILITGVLHFSFVLPRTTSMEMLVSLSHFMNDVFIKLFIGNYCPNFPFISWLVIAGGSSGRG